MNKTKLVKRITFEYHDYVVKISPILHSIKRFFTLCPNNQEDILQNKIFLILSEYVRKII